MSIWDRPYLTDTASWSEVFLAVVGVLYLGVWRFFVWNARRKGENFYNEKAPRWIRWYFMAVTLAIGVVAVVCAVAAFLPGDVFDIFASSD